MLTVVTWLWGRIFAPVYVSRLHSMLRRHLHIPFELVCVTDDADGIDPEVRIVAPPPEYASAPRCRRRMWQFAKERADIFGARVLAIDLDVVIVDDLTPIVDRPEPVVGWRVGYAGVYSGSFLLFDVGVLDRAWCAYRDDPDGYPKATGERNASDQAMLNHWLRGRRIAEWTEADGFVTWFGNGYARHEQKGMGPGRPNLPRGARIVVMGSADKAVLDEGRYPFVREHWR